MSITFGSDTYGRVKGVDGTPIVTKFWMLQLLPVWPLESYYFLSAGQSESSGVPFVAGEVTAQFNGIPLARLERASVVIAYLRAVFGTLFVFGFLVIVPGFSILSGERLDDLAMTFVRILIACAVTGAVGGLLTYLVPLTSRREKEIRRHCGRLLGVSVDPAVVMSEVAGEIAKSVEELVFPFDENDTVNAEWTSLRELVLIRCEMATAADPLRQERDTENLLERLRGFR